ncbi:MAG: hypothetical protein QGD90_13065 [Candidatus Hydrogenedentes bacterium]|nr:hypothetical protein [Candidatus Hydrogenedentota bacterium]
MLKRTTLAIAMLVILGSIGVITAAEEEDQVAAAMTSLDEFMAAFNARDMEAWSKTLNYPHVRIASGTVRVWESPEEYAGRDVFAMLTSQYGWDHSVWDKREVVQSGKDKVHLATTFSRYDKDGNKIATFDSLYIVTKQDGHWGTQARSSFAP